MLRFTHHAQQRLADRHVSVAEAKQVWQYPDTTYNDLDGKPCRVAEVGGRRIKLVLAPDDIYLVITVIVQASS